MSILGFYESRNIGYPLPEDVKILTTEKNSAQ